jgi:hypothetical protein
MHKALRLWISFCLSWLIWGVIRSIDYNPNGPLIHPVFQGLVLTLWSTPFYVIAALLVQWLSWPPWSQLVLSAVGYVGLYVLAFYFAGSEFSDLKSLPEAFQAAFNFWMYSLAFGIPLCICDYASMLFQKYMKGRTTHSR